MTLRSRLSAAWKAFKRDDFPPVRATPLDYRAGDFAGYPPVRLDLKANTTYNVNPPVDMSPHQLPSMADETEALRKEQEAELSRLTPDYSNLEVPAIIRKRRKKLVSVPKE